MRKFIAGAAGLLAIGAAQAQICIEYDTCYASMPVGLGVPDFVIIDLKENAISMTKASHENRSTRFATVGEQEGLIYVQGIENGRAFSFVIDEATGRMTAAVSRDGLTVSVCGACTDANL